MFSDHNSTELRRGCKTQQGNGVSSAVRLLSATHTALSPNPGPCSSQEKWDVASFGEFWGMETLRSFTVKCPIILTGTIKAGPRVCDSSNERQLFMSFSTLTEHVLGRHTCNPCTKFTVSTGSCPRSLQKGILMA